MAPPALNPGHDDRQVVWPCWARLVRMDVRGTKVDEHEAILDLVGAWFGVEGEVGVALCEPVEVWLPGWAHRRTGVALVA